MYTKLSEVLEKQGQIAFSDPKETKEYKTIEEAINKQQQLYNVYTQTKKTWKEKLDLFEKTNNEAGKSMALKQLDSVEKFLEPQKKKIDAMKRNLKKFENAQTNMVDNLKKKGIKNMEDLNKKVSEYNKLAVIAQANIDNAEKMYDEYYQQALEDNKRNEISLMPVEEQVTAYVNNIRENLHPMDEAWKAKLKEENEKQFKKSLFIIQGGRFFIRKSY